LRGAATRRGENFEDAFDPMDLMVEAVSEAGLPVYRRGAMSATEETKR
jgi:hypothetical protein